MVSQHLGHWNRQRKASLRNCMGVQGIPRSTLLGSPRTHSVQLGLLFWLVCSLFCYHSTSFFLKIFLATSRLACGILVPQPGTEPMPPVIGRVASNHWIAREFPTTPFLCWELFSGVDNEVYSCILHISLFRL